MATEVDPVVFKDLRGPVIVRDDLADAIRPLARGLDHHPRHRRIVGPSVELRAQRAYHAVSEGIERLRPVERDDAGGAAPLEQDVVGHGRLRK